MYTYYGYRASYFSLPPSPSPCRGVWEPYIGVLPPPPPGRGVILLYDGVILPTIGVWAPKEGVRPQNDVIPPRS